jgi:hypothetical protein
MIPEELIKRLVEEFQNRFYGKYRGIVTENLDPSSSGRIMARVPQVLGDGVALWCTPCVPYAGSNKGWFVIPEIGDAVWIEFEAGDPDRPIWVGSWYGNGETPVDPAGSMATTQTKIFKSASGLMIDLDDNASEIKISDANGINLINIQVTQGKISIKATTNVTIEAPVINLGDNGSHPIVLGDSLIQYLSQLVMTMQTHIHPATASPAGPPVTLFTPPDPSLLSTIVTTK